MLVRSCKLGAWYNCYNVAPLRQAMSLLKYGNEEDATSTTGQDFLRHLQVLNFARNSVYRFALTPLCSALSKTLYEIVLVLTRSLLLALRCRTIGRAAEAGSAPGRWEFDGVRVENALDVEHISKDPGIVVEWRKFTYIIQFIIAKFEYGRIWNVKMFVFHASHC